MDVSPRGLINGVSLDICANAVGVGRRVNSPDGAMEADASSRAPLVSPARAYGVLIALSLTGFLMVTNEVSPFGLINLIATDLDRSQSEVGLLVTGYALVVVVASVPLAMATTRVPRRLLLTLTLLVWATGALVTALSQDYSALLIGRLLTALAQTVYWAVVTATVAGLFPPGVRGRIVSRMLLGPASAALLGLPTATWLGQQEGWRAPFFVLAALGVMLAIAVAILVPGYKPGDGAASRGTEPHRKRFAALMVITMLSILGLMVVYTYITPFLTEVSGFAESSMPTLLTASGIAGIVGMWVAGRFLDRYPRGTLAAGQITLLTCWIAMSLFGTVGLMGALFYVVMGAAFSTIVAGLMNRTMQLSPGSTDMGVAIYSSMYNTGIALGSGLGAGILAWYSPALLPIAGAVFIAMALGLLTASNWRAVMARKSAPRA
jgi:predicted MFS family arabinose efflux permease